MLADGRWAKLKYEVHVKWIYKTQWNEEKINKIIQLFKIKDKIIVFIYLWCNTCIHTKNILVPHLTSVFHLLSFKIFHRDQACFLSAQLIQTKCWPKQVHNYLNRLISKCLHHQLLLSWVDGDRKRCAEREKGSLGNWAYLFSLLSQRLVYL